MFQKVNFIKNKPIPDHSFDEMVDDNPFGYKMYLTSAFIAGPRSGKSVAIINLTKYLQKNNLISEIFLMSPSIESNPWDKLDIPEENKFYNLDHFNQDLNSIMNYCKSKVEKWRMMKEEINEKQYNKHYKRVYKLYKHHMKLYDDNNVPIIVSFDDEPEPGKELNLSNEDIELLENNNFQPNPTKYYNYGPSFLLILDDIMGSDATANKKGNLLNECLSNHRHMKLSIFLAIQSYKSSIPAHLRTMVNQYFLWKTPNLQTIKSFYEEIANNLFDNFDDFLAVYRQCTNKKHSFIMVDKFPKDTSLSIRKNFNEILIKKNLHHEESKPLPQEK